MALVQGGAGSPTKFVDESVFTSPPPSPTVTSSAAAPGLVSAPVSLAPTAVASAQSSAAVTSGSFEMHAFAPPPPALLAPSMGIESSPLPLAMVVPVTSVFANDAGYGAGSPFSAFQLPFTTEVATGHPTEDTPWDGSSWSFVSGDSEAWFGGWFYV